MQSRFKLNIPEPCTQKWHGMAPAEKGRYCASCQKKVVDFAVMTDQQLLQYFNQQSTGVCGRFHPEQLNRTLHTPTAIKSWAHQLFKIAMPAFLFSARAAAQSSKPVPQAIVVHDSPTTKDNAPAASPWYEGRVVDERGMGVPNASVVVKNTNWGTLTDTLGYFKLKRELVIDKILDVSSVGFTSQQVQVDVNKSAEIVMVVMQFALTGEVVVVGYTLRKPANPFTWVKQKLQPDTAMRQLQLFPNPMPAGGSITLRWKKFGKGTHTIQVTNAAGQVIHINEIEVTNSNGSQLFQPPRLTPGVYYLKLANSKTGQSYTQSFLVQ